MNTEHSRSSRGAFLGALGLAAAAGAVSSLGFLTSNLAFVAPGAAAQTAPAASPAPSLLASPKAAAVVGRRQRVPGHALGEAAGDRPDRAHAPARRPMDELSRAGPMCATASSTAISSPSRSRRP